MEIYEREKSRIKQRGKKKERKKEKWMVNLQSASKCLLIGPKTWVYTLSQYTGGMKVASDTQTKLIGPWGWVYKKNSTNQHELANRF